MESQSLEFIQKYWQILVAAITFIVGYINLNNDVKNVKKDQIETDKSLEILETKFDEHKEKMFETMSEIQKDIREIMTIIKGTTYNK